MFKGHDTTVRENMHAKYNLVTLMILLNAQKFMKLHDHSHDPFSKMFKMSCLDCLRKKVRQF